MYPLSFSSKVSWKIFYINILSFIIMTVYNSIIYQMLQNNKNVCKLWIMSTVFPSAPEIWAMSLRSNALCSCIACYFNDSDLGGGWRRKTQRWRRRNIYNKDSVSYLPAPAPLHRRIGHTIIHYTIVNQRQRYTTKLTSASTLWILPEITGFHVKVKSRRSYTCKVI